METRETKSDVNSIKMSVDRLRTSNLKILAEVKETNKLLKEILKLMREEEMRRKIG